MNRKEKGQRKDMDVVCGTSFEPSRIYKILNGIRTDTFIVEGRQEDAEEFFGCILNGLNDEMLEVSSLYVLSFILFIFQLHVQANNIHIIVFHC